MRGLYSTVSALLEEMWLHYLTVEMNVQLRVCDGGVTNREMSDLMNTQNLFISKVYYYLRRLESKSKMDNGHSTHRTTTLYAFEAPHLIVQK